MTELAKQLYLRLEGFTDANTTSRQRSIGSLLAQHEVAHLQADILQAGDDELARLTAIIVHQERLNYTSPAQQHRLY